jgi:DNA-binding transcriptional ArsR family regulator
VAANHTSGADRALTALGDPTRRAVFAALARGPRSVGDLARDLPVTRPAVSQHLKVLKDAGLVTDEAVGTRRLYRIDPGGVGAVRQWFDGFWTDALDQFKRAAEATAPSPDHRKRRNHPPGKEPS